MSENFWKKYEKDIVMHGSKMNVVESCVDRHLLNMPDKLALVFEDEKGRKEFSWSELEKGVNRFANYFFSIGVKKGARVFIFLPKVSEMYLAILGAIKIGAIAAPLF